VSFCFVRALASLEVAEVTNGYAVFFNLKIRHMKYASTANRVFARLLDILIYYSLAIIVYETIIYKNDHYNNKMLLTWILLYGLMIRWLVYYPLMEASGGIWGKRILGIKTVSRETGLPITIKQSYKRTWYIIKGLIVGYIPILLGQSLRDRGEEKMGEFMVYTSIFLWILWLARTYFYKEFGFPRHDYASLVIVRDKNKTIAELVAQFEDIEPGIEAKKDKKLMKFKMPSLPKVNIGNAITLYVILLVFIHAMFHFNRTYTVGSMGTFSNDQYEKLTQGGSVHAKRIIEITTVKYFDKFPEWSINIIYIGYLILAILIFFIYSKKDNAQKQPLTVHQKRIIGMNLLMQKIKKQ